jgi:hypothetical protein
VEFVWGPHLQDDIITTVWNSLRVFTRLTHLELRSCHMASISDAYDIFTSVYTKLQSVVFDSVDFDSNVPPAEPLEIAVLPTLYRIWHISENKGDISELLQLLHCPNLTDLYLCEPDILPIFSSSLAHVQGLLASAQNLRALTIPGQYITGGLNLKPNVALEKLAIHNVGTGRNPTGTWLADTLSTLPVPIQLKRLEIWGKLSQLKPRFWAALDETLSNPRFACDPGMRSLQITDMDLFISPLDEPFVIPVLTQTKQLGWFKVT